MAEATDGRAAPSTTAPPPSTSRERTGWYFYDWANSAFSTTVITVFLGPFLTTITETGRRLRAGRRRAATAASTRSGITIAAGSLLPVPGVAVGVADRVRAAGDRARSPTARRTRSGCWPAPRSSARPPRSGCCSSPATGTCSAALLFLVANIAFGASVVVYNSFLPQLAGPDDRDEVSSRGWALGYLGGGLLLLLNLVAVTLFSEDGNAAAHPRPGPLVHRLGRRVVGGCSP